MKTPNLARAALFFAGLGRLSAAEPATSAPRVIDEPLATYPLMASVAGVQHGEAHAVLSIGRDGALVDFLIVGSTHPAFAQELAHNLRLYRFAPARVRGEPQAVRWPATFRFRNEGSMASVTAIESLISLEQKSELTGPSQWFVSRPASLDQPIRPVETVSPRYPAEMATQRVAAEVTVDFFVDGEGRVRLPAVENSLDPAFAREAVQAISAWRFTPPTRNGQPTIVKVAQVFRFAPPPVEPRG